LELSKGLFKEVSPKGIRVVRVSPGWIETEAAVRLVKELAKNTGTDYEGARQGLMNSIGGIPIGRPARAERSGGPRRLSGLAARRLHHWHGVCHHRRRHRILPPSTSTRFAVGCEDIHNLSARMDHASGIADHFQLVNTADLDIGEDVRLADRLTSTVATIRPHRVDHRV